MRSNAAAVDQLKALAQSLTEQGLDDDARFPLACASAVEVLMEEGVEGTRECSAGSEDEWIEEKLGRLSINGGGGIGATWVVSLLKDLRFEDCRALIEEWRILLAIAHTVSPYTTPRTRNGSRKPAGRDSFLEMVGRRDDWSCAVTGLGHLQLALDFLPADEIKGWKSSRRARPRLVGHCKVGHLFPVASVERPDYPRFLERLTGIAVPYNSATKVDDPRNGIVLDGTLNSLYATLDLAFKATEKENEYEIVYSAAWRETPGYPQSCTFTTQTDIPLPDPSILRVYYLLHRVLHSSSAATELLHPAVDYNPLELEGLPGKGTGGEAVLGVALLKQILSAEAEKRASEFGKEV